MSEGSPTPQKSILFINYRQRVLTCQAAVRASQAMRVWNRQGFKKQYYYEKTCFLLQADCSWKENL